MTREGLLTPCLCLPNAGFTAVHHRHKNTNLHIHKCLRSSLNYHRQIKIYLKYFYLIRFCCLYLIFLFTVLRFHLPMLKGQLQLFFHRKLSVLSSKTTFPVTLKMHSEKRMTVEAAEPLEASACQCALHLCVKNVQLFTRVQHSWQ